MPTHSFTGVLYPISLQTKPLQLLKWIYNKDKDFNSSCSGTVIQVLYIHHSHFSFITMNNPEHLYSCKFSWLVSTRKQQNPADPASTACQVATIGAAADQNQVHHRFLPTNRQLAGETPPWLVWVTNRGMCFPLEMCPGETQEQVEERFWLEPLASQLTDASGWVCRQDFWKECQRLAQ